MLRLLALAIFYALLTACAAQAPVAEQEVETKPEPAAEVAERPFPKDSLYALLVAEFALRRQAYDVTLQQYMEQATMLRDAGVSAHTTHLTQFLQREGEAQQAARLWVELEPENAEANNTLAALLARQGRTLEALPYLAVVERQTGSANFPMLLNGFGQLNNEQRAELVEGINKLNVEFPKNTSLLLTQAMLHTEYQQYDKALDELRTLFKLEPEQPQAILLEAKILAEQKAANPYARLQRILQENPDAQMLRLQYARLLTATDMPAAREQFEILSAQSPKDSDLLLSLALINREIGDPAATITYLRQVIALGPRADEAYYYLGRMAEENGNPEAAISEYMRVKEGEEYFAANNRIGQILVDGGQLDRYHAWFDQQREEKPPLRDQLYGLEADILSRAGSTREAMQVLNKALAKMPDNTSLRYARAMLNEQLDDLVSMEQDLRFILAADPDNTTALNALGYTLADRTTRYTEALTLVSRALELQPNEPAILDSMGWVLFRTGRNDEAVEYLTRAYANFPDPEVAAHLGEVLWVKGDNDAAMAVWQGALARDPGHPVLLGTLNRLGIVLPGAASSEDSPPESAP
ncbi:MAG TPA: tetratricopeptide repeat protein [Halioglobus sp.]